MNHDWFLTEEERGNPHTRITAWTDGNAVRPLVDGKEYFAELYAAIERMERGDLLLFTDWRGDANQKVSRNGPSIGEVLCDAARRGVRDGYRGAAGVWLGDAVLMTLSAGGVAS